MLVQFACLRSAASAAFHSVMSREGATEEGTFLSVFVSFKCEFYSAASGLMQRW